MVAEVLIYVPSIANFRLNWLNDRLAAAHTAALVLDAAPSGMVPESLAKQILNSIGARAVAMKMGTQRRLLAADNVPSQIEQDIDMRNVSWWRAIMDAFDTMLFSAPDDVLRLVGPAPMAEGQFIEIVLDEAPLRKAMLTFSVNILLLSLVISGVTAMLVFFALHYLLVRPMGRITANMITFRADPENPARIIAESGRGDEIGTAEVELAAMQRELASMLHQKNRLAALGLAVSKINHDLRNLLASAQLFSDQLSTLPDPKVQRFAPKLMRALERAIAFCQSTLSYGAAQEPPPERKTIEVGPLIEEVHEALGLGLDVPIRWIVSVERGLTMEADHDQLFRVLVNVARNARAGAGGARRARSGPRPDPHHRPARRQRGDHRGVRHRPGRLGKGARPICSRPFRAPRGPAAPDWAWPLPPNWCAPMAAKSAWCREPSARPSASRFPTARSISTPGAASGRARSVLHAGAGLARQPLPIAALGDSYPSVPRPDFPAAVSAPVAQLDRAPDYESGGQEFESLRARHKLLLQELISNCIFLCF